MQIQRIACERKGYTARDLASVRILADREHENY
jgi:hypothetical protein